MIWLVGAKGMLGQEVAFQLRQRGLKFVSSGSEVDISDYEALLSFAQNTHLDPIDNRISFIINCAAYTAVDNAEDEDQRQKAYNVNVLGPENLAKIARSISATLIHISTDYVFDGTAVEPIKENADKILLEFTVLQKAKAKIRCAIIWRATLFLELRGFTAGTVKILFTLWRALCHQKKVLRWLLTKKVLLQTAALWRLL